MESSPTSSIVFLDLAGKSIDAPVEWTPARIVLQVDGLDGVSLYCQPLGMLPLSMRLLDGQLRVIADWTCADAGHYQLTLFHHEQQLAERAVTVLPKKIDVDAYGYMLEDLDSRLPASIVLGLQRAGALAGLQFLPPGQSTLAQELARLRRAVRGSSEPGLAQVLKSLALDPHEPHKILEAREIWLPRMHARRPHPSRLTQAVTRPGNLDVVRLPINVLDTRVEHSFDTYENRLLKYFCNLVYFHLRRLIHVLEKMLRKSARLAIDLAEARQLQHALTGAMQRASFLSEVSEPAYIPIQITMVLLNQPLYRAMLEGLLEFQKRLTVRLDEPALEAPLENLPKLYQVWGTLHVLAVMLHTAAGLGYKIQAQHLARRDEHGVFIQILPDGRPALEMVHPVDGTIVRFIPERTYGPKGTLHSITYEQRPDIALEIYAPAVPPVVYIFDPKYKLEQDTAANNERHTAPEKADIDKMHAYRDAIRDNNDSPVVAYAAILYPGTTQRYHPGIEALQAYPEATAMESLEQHLRRILTVPLQPRVPE